jgi:hypothetical protein
MIKPKITILYIDNEPNSLLVYLDISTIAFAEGWIKRGINLGVIVIPHL